MDINGTLPSFTTAQCLSQCLYETEMQENYDRVEDGGGGVVLGFHCKVLKEKENMLCIRMSSASGSVLFRPYLKM